MAVPSAKNTYDSSVLNMQKPNISQTVKPSQKNCTQKNGTKAVTDSKISQKSDTLRKLNLKQKSWI